MDSRLDDVTVADVNAPLPRCTSPDYVFDISDLIFFLVHHDNPSGIQRVQISIISYLLNGPSQGLPIKFVFFDDQSNSFRTLDVAIVTSFLADLTLPKPERTFPTGRGDIYELTEALGAGPELQAARGTVLILLGAAWVFPEYFTAVKGIQFYGGRFCCLIHDLVPIKLPSMCDKGTSEVFKFFIRRVIHYADAIMCVSEWTKRDLAEYARGLGKPLPPVTVVHNGTDLLRPSNRAERPLEPEDAGDFVLFVSTIEGRKNHELALRAWQRLKIELGERTPRLVLIGRVGWRVETLIESLYETQFLDGLIEIKNDVSDEYLATLYRNCLFTIYPSRYEGWGLPVAESLASGKVCVASSATSIPEVARGCAILIDPDDLDGFHAQLLRCIADREYLRDQEKYVRKNYKPYTWEEVCDGLLDGVNGALNAPSRFPMEAPAGLEWTFRRLEYLSSNVMHGEEVAAFFERFTCPALLNAPLHLDNYIASELATPGVGWYPREEWGRWSEMRSGARFEFLLATSSRVSAYIQVKVPTFSPGDLISLEDRNRHQKFFELNDAIATIEFSLEPYKHGNVVCFTLKYISVNGEHNPQDIVERQPGLGIVAAVLAEETDSAAQMQLESVRTAEAARAQRTATQNPELRPEHATHRQPSLGSIAALFASDRDIFAGFDGEYYLSENKDVARQSFDALDHYIRYGWKENRKPAEHMTTLEFFAFNPGAMRRLARQQTDSMVSRTLRRLTTSTSSSRHAAADPAPQKPGVLLIGYVEASLGVGESLRGFAKSLATTQLPFAIYPYNVNVETRIIGPFMRERYDCESRYDINVIEMAADQLPGFFTSFGEGRIKSSYNILRTAWELPSVPREWGRSLERVDEIWVPTKYVQQAFRSVYDGPIQVFPHCVDTESDKQYGRSYFGMEHDRFYFLFSFDYFSTPARKNPIGVLRAFRLAFPDLNEKVGLIIKSTNTRREDFRIRRMIAKAATEDPRIMVLDKPMSRDEILSLIRQSDCYVSLHRSEGFGLGMAEAMAFGNIVIGTNYSGSTDFLSERTGFPVNYTERTLRQGEYIYAEGQSWAEPDERAAIEAMQRAFYDQSERRRRASAGKALVQTRYGRENVGRIAETRLTHILALIRRLRT